LEAAEFPERNAAEFPEPSSPQAAIVNGSALTDHHFTVSSVSGDAARQLDPK
jgi:hypothetical protein